MHFTNWEGCNEKEWTRNIISNNTNNISPLRYPGGKTRACKIINNILLQYFDINNFDTIISPFFGGGSFEFYLQNNYGLKLIVNDKFTPLYNFWKQIKINKQILCDELRKITIITKEQFIDYRNTIMNLNDNSIYDFKINQKPQMILKDNDKIKEYQLILYIVI